MDFLKVPDRLNHVRKKDDELKANKNHRNTSTMWCSSNERCEFYESKLDVEGLKERLRSN